MELLPPTAHGSQWPASRATAAPWNITWDNSGSSDTSVTVSIRITDRAGNRAQYDRDYRIDNHGPYINLDYFPQVGTGPSRLSAWVTDDGGIAYAALRGGSKARFVDGEMEARISLAEGKRELVWEAVDTNGNLGIARRTVIVDATAPTLKVTKAPKNKAKVKGTVKMTASSTDRFTCAAGQSILGRGGPRTSSASMIL